MSPDTSRKNKRSTPITLKTSPADRWIKIIASSGSVRGVAIQATQLVQSMADLHGASGKVAEGFGEAIMGALLLSSYSKQGERINLNIQGSGYVRQALVDAYPDATVRGYVVGRSTAPDLATVEGPETGPWGTGVLSVLRTKTEDRNQPYIGTVPMITGHLAKDLTFYWVQSEQVPSAVGLAVIMKDAKVLAAGGFLIQAMPGATPTEISTIEQHIHEIQSLAGELAEDADPLHLLSRIFQSTAFAILEERPLTFKCNCSWERVYRALTLIGVEELKAMLKEDQKASVRCDFCTKDYEVEAEELQQMIDKVSGKSES